LLLRKGFRALPFWSFLAIKPGAAASCARLNY
jgi:hypothetical protein